MSEVAKADLLADAMLCKAAVAEAVAARNAAESAYRDAVAALKAAERKMGEAVSVLRQATGYATAVSFDGKLFDLTRAYTSPEHPYEMTPTVTPFTPFVLDGDTGSD